MIKKSLFMLAVAALILLSSCGEKNSRNFTHSQVSSRYVKADEAIFAPEQLPIAFAGRGNSGGNSVNGGFAAVYRNKLFFADASTEGRLASLNAKGIRLLTDFRVSNINTYDGWIFFCNESDNNILYRCRTDGSELSIMGGVSAQYPQVVGSWIYFSNMNDSGKLYRISTDGKQTEKICDDSVAEINAYPETVFYKNLSDNSAVYYISTDKSDKGRIINKPCSSFNAYGISLFYIDLSDGMIYRSSLDGLYVTNTGKHAKCINVLGEYVYYSDGAAIYRMSFDGENAEKLTDARTENLEVVGSTVYYIDSSDGDLYVIYPTEDGLQKERLSGTYYESEFD